MSLPWLERHDLPVAPGPGAPGWPAAVAALAPALAARRGRRVRVVLSNHFVRYALVPWRDDLRSPAERDAFARHVVAAAFGPAAAQWRVREDPGAYGKATLACAVDPGLLEALRAAARAARVHVDAVEPLLMAAFNAARRRLPRSACLLVQEHGRLAGLALSPAGWEAIFTMRSGYALDDAAVARELVLHGVRPDVPAFAAEVGDLADLRPLERPHRWVPAGNAFALAGAAA